MEERYDAEGDDEGGGVDQPLRNAQRVQQRFDKGRDDGLSQSAQSEGGDRNTKLAHGEVRVQPLANLPDNARRRPALLDEPVDLRGSYPHEGELRGHEQPIQGHQDEGGKDPEQGDDYFQNRSSGGCVRARPRSRGAPVLDASPSSMGSKYTSRYGLANRSSTSARQHS